MVELVGVGRDASVGEHAGIHRYRPYALLLLPVFAGLFWTRRHVLPLLMWGSFTLSFCMVGLAGAVAHRVLVRRANSSHEQQPPGLFLRMWLGQCALFALSFLIGLPASLFHALTSWHIPLHATLPVALLAIAYRFYFAGNAATEQRAPVPIFSLLLAATAALGFYRVLYFHSEHAGALGHDTIQHIYWTQTIVDYGYLPAVGRNTDLLETYPRLFHLMTASWSAVGVFGEVGPYTKMMPLLQEMLACGLFAELMLASRPGGSTRTWELAPVAIGLFIAWHLSLGDGSQVYRTVDLSGTPRTSAGWVLFGFPLAVLASRVGVLPDMRAPLAFAAPLFAVIALGINPATFAYFLSFSLPFAVLLYLGTRALVSVERISWFRPLLWGSLGSVPLLLTNSFVLGAVKDLSGIPRLLAAFGVRTVLRGQPAPPFPDSPAEAVKICDAAQGLECGAEVVTSSLQEGTNAFFKRLISGTPPGWHIGENTFWYFVAFVAPLFLLALVTRRASAQPGTQPRSSQLFIAFFAASLLAQLPLYLGNAALVRFEKLNDFVTLFVTYYRPHPVYLSSFMQCALPLSSWFLVRPLSWNRPALAATALLVTSWTAVQLNGLVPQALLTHRHANPTWNVDWAELRAIRHLNDFVPEGEAVLIPAYHWAKGRENLLVADGPEGIIVPHLKARTLFAVGMGNSKDYGWVDLVTRFCATPEKRRALLQEANVRWVLVRIPGAQTRETYDKFRWQCGLSLRDVGAKFPAAWSEQDLALYHIEF